MQLPRILVLLLTIIVCHVQVQAARTVVVAGHDLKDTHGATAETRIRNDNPTPAVFTVEAMDALTVNLNATLLRGTSGLSRRDAQIRVLQNVAAITKNPRLHANSFLIASNIFQDRMLAERFLTWSATSLHVMQCGNATELAIALAIRSGLFQADDFRVVSYNQVHTTSEVRLDRSAWALVDFDPGMPGFMSLKPDGQFASIADIRRQPTLVRPWNVFQGKPTSVGRSVAQYAAIFSAAPDAVVAPASAVPSTDANTAHWALCAGCEIGWKYARPHVFDLHDPGVHASVLETQANYECWARSANQACLHALQKWLARNQIKADLAQLQSVIGFTWGQEQEVDTKAPPTFTVDVPASNRPRTIGVAGDLHIPLVVSKARITGGSMVLHGITLTGDHQSNLYNLPRNEASARVPPTIAARDFLTLTNGTIPAGVSVQFEVFYNPGVMSFLRGFHIRQASAGNPLRTTSAGHVPKSSASRRPPT